MKTVKKQRTALPGRAASAALLFKTGWGWMGLKAGAKGIEAVVLPKPSKRAVEAALGNGIAAFSPDRHAAGVLREARAQMLAYFAGRRKSFLLPLDLSSGTAFQRRVWRAIQRVPYGRVRSYKWVAAKVGGSRYARAVGNALGANPLPIIVPCHRAVAHDASLGGFSGGLATKRLLLKLERTLPLLLQSRKRGRGRRSGHGTRARR